MAVVEVVGDRYRVDWEDMGKPTVRGTYEVPGFGMVVLDDADVHYAVRTPGAAFFVRKSRALQGSYVVVSRVQPA